MKLKGTGTVLFAGFVFLVIVSASSFFTPVIEWVAPHFVRADSLCDSGVGAVVALTSGAVSDTTLDDAGAARLRAAIAVARISNARRIVTSRVATANGYTDSTQSRIIARAHLDAQWLIVPGVVRNTRDEATALASILDTSNRVAVVTSPLHTIRACAAFEAVGFRVMCVPSREPDRGTLRRRWFMLYALVYERVAIRKYRFQGWMR